jgi:hypothetical protein
MKTASGGGGSPTGGGSPAGGGSSPAGSGGSLADGGGCINPTEGQPCTPDQTVCFLGDPCCVGGWGCDPSTMTWQKQFYGCGCPPPVPCGTTMCQPGTSYCEAAGPGVAPADGGTPSPSYACVAIPPSCVGGPTCACIEAVLGPSRACTCAQDPSGIFAVHCPEA